MKCAVLVFRCCARAPREIGLNVYMKGAGSLGLTIFSGATVVKAMRTVV